MVSPDTSSPDPSTSLAMKTQENTDDDPEDPEPADGGDTQMEYSSHKLYTPSINPILGYLYEVLSV